MHRILIPLLLVFTAFTSHQTEDAKSILKKSEDKLRGNTSYSELAIKIVRPKWSRTIELSSWSKGSEYALAYIKSPAKDKGVVFLKRGREVWNYMPKVESVVKLPPSMMSQNWMGTDLSNDDLVSQSSIINDYSHKLLGSESINGVTCHKIELIPKPEAPVVWGKVVSWISKDEYIQMKTAFYDEDEELVNTLIGSDIKTLAGRKLATTYTMIPADKDGHKTIMSTHKLVIDAPINDDFFTIRNAKKLRL